MEWIFVVAVVLVLGAKVWLARGGYRRSKQPAPRDLDAGRSTREAPDHLPGRGTGRSEG